MMLLQHVLLPLMALQRFVEVDLIVPQGLFGCTEAKL